MQVKIEGIKELQDKLGKYANQVPFALSKAMNETLSGAQKAVVKEINDVFQAPTPSALRSVRWSATTKRNLTGDVHISTGEGVAGGRDFSAIFRPHVTGGDRIVKASERWFKAHGWMGQGQWMVPATRDGIIPIDKYGNIPGNVMKRIMAQLGYCTPGHNKMGKAASRRGIGDVYGVPFVGVFNRTGPKSSIALLVFTYTKPQYEEGRFDFYYVVKQHIEKNFAENFKKSMSQAISTAR